MHEAVAEKAKLRQLFNRSHHQMLYKLQYINRVTYSQCYRASHHVDEG
jgi:hypothetical protein